MVHFENFLLNVNGMCPHTGGNMQIKNAAWEGRPAREWQSNKR